MGVEGEELGWGLGVRKGQKWWGSWMEEMEGWELGIRRW